MSSWLSHVGSPFLMVKSCEITILWCLNHHLSMCWCWKIATSFHVAAIPRPCGSRKTSRCSRKRHLTSVVTLLGSMARPIMTHPEMAMDPCGNSPAQKRAVAFFRNSEDPNGSWNNYGLLLGNGNYSGLNEELCFYGTMFCELYCKVLWYHAIENKIHIYIYI